MSRRNSELFLAGQITRNYFLASQRTARWEGRRLHPGCLSSPDVLKSCEGYVHPALVSSPETLDVAGEARRETRAKQAKPVGSNLQGRLGKLVRNKGEVGIPARRRGSCWSGNPAAGIVFKILRKPTRHLDRVQNLGFGPLGERRLLGSVAVYNTLHRGHPGHPDIPLRPPLPAF